MQLHTRYNYEISGGNIIIGMPHEVAALTGKKKVQFPFPCRCMLGTLEEICLVERSNRIGLGKFNIFFTSVCLAEV